MVQAEMGAEQNQIINRIERRITMVRVPQIEDIEFAIKLYYSRPQISNKDISELFPKSCDTTICNLKKAVVKKMAENGEMRYNSKLVSTKTAYETWGIDIEDLEFRYNKLKKLAL